MKILIACEFSGIVRDAFIKRGHDAVSCDLLPTERPGPHIQGDVLRVLDGLHKCCKCGDYCKVDHNSFRCDKCERMWSLNYPHEIDKWDLMIAHPPCTYLCVTGNKWFKPEYKDRFPDRHQQREDAVKFFMSLAETPIEKISLENPVCIMSSRWRKPDQYIHPYQFGEPHSKKTGLWLKNLPLLKLTEVVEPKYYIYKDGRKDPLWHVETMKLPKTDRTKARSRTFQGIADAMADQWGT